MAVYLDTNVLDHPAGPESLEVNTALGVCSEKQVDVVLPSTVVDELHSRRLLAIEAAFDGIQAAHRAAGRHCHVPPPELPNPGILADEFRHDLEGRFSIAALPDGAPQEALRREAFRIRPARDGRGARDVAIWLSAIDDHLARDEPGHLVTANTKDFAAPGEPATLHPNLASEVSGHGHPLRLHTSLESIVAEFASPADCLIDSPDELTTLPEFKGRLAELTLDPEFLELIDTRELLGVAPDQGRIFAAGPVSVADVELSDMRGYDVDGSRVCAGRLRAGLSFEIGVVRKSSGWRLSQRLAPVSCTVTAFLWLSETAAGVPPAVEIARTLAVRLTA